ncbi:uncharacterized protein LOC119739635 [Patiria miniata]|uniref:Uncharacterized protein n=1 Tax=Patiria miniata TaxID=46514 RepID=A0A914B4Z9_PATMI|nr:uncharacterized protein LOC119739635 [Patiria miniata]
MAQNRTSSVAVPANFDRTRVVAARNPMAPPLVPRIVIEALPALLMKIKTGRYDEFGQPQSAEKQVANALQNMSVMYKTVGKAHYLPQPDFEDPAFHVAYVYQYLTKHCHLIYQMLWMLLPFGIATQWLERGVNVCSIGGGPGTDVIGVLVYLRSLRSYLDKPASERVIGYVLDKFADAWTGTWQDIRASNSVLRESQIYCRYISCDLLDDLPTAAMEEEIREADLVTMVKAFSAFIAFMRDGRDIRQCAVSKLLMQLKRGAVVLFIDNMDELYLKRRAAPSWRLRKSQNETFLQDIVQPAGLISLGEWHGSTNTWVMKDSHLQLKRYIQERFHLDWSTGLRKCAVSVFLLYKP